MENERRASGPEKTIAVIVAAASLALAVSGAFVAWRDYVHDQLSSIAERVSLVDADMRAYHRERAFHISRIDKIEARLDAQSGIIQLLSERLIRCEQRGEL